MGIVYLATQESLKRDVVLKTMNVNDADSTEFAERSLNEGRILAQLRHPHIVTIYDIGRADDTLYTAVEYVDGGDLKSRLTGPLPPYVCFELLRIGAALEHAHDQGVIHRDIKPANILFRRDGMPLLSNFCIAKQIYIALGRQVDPSHRGLAALETFIDSQQMSFWEGLVALFKS